MADEEQQESQTQQEDERRGEQTTAEEDEPKQEAQDDKNQEEEEEEEEERKREEARKEEERKKEEQRKKEEEQRKKEEARKRREEEAKKKEEEEAKKKEEAKGHGAAGKKDDKSSRPSELDSEDQTDQTSDRSASPDEPGKADEPKAADEKHETSDGRHRQREFFKEELKRLQGSLKRESSKIVPPSRRKYTPFIFNTLEPYYNTRTTRFLIDMPDEGDQFFTFSSRNTAQGLTDPWIDLRMDQEILPQISSRPNTRHEGKPRRANSKLKSRKSGDQQSEPNRKEGSTRLPKFPVVNLETKELATKQLYYSDVPMLRKELKNKYSSQARSKVEADYKRTQADFYRMDLDRLDQVAPSSRQHLTSTYRAYLQNTPGSRRAVSECVRALEGKAN